MDLAQVTLDELASACAEETARFHQGIAIDTAVCFELFRRVFDNNLTEAFTHVYSIYLPQVLRWVRSHSLFESTHEEADYFANIAFSNFFFALKQTHLSRFESLGKVLQYLKLCAYSTVTQYMRDHQRLATVPLEADWLPASTPDPAANVEAEELWARICVLLPGEEDRFLVRCIFVEALKPAQIAEAYPARWETSRQVSVALQRIRRVLQRDDQLRELARLSVPADQS